MTDSWNGIENAPEFDRLHYYYGQMLGARDFQTEQDYFRNKLKLMNRCLHGYGVVCGLKVEESDDKGQLVTAKYAPGGGKYRPLHILISSGLAIDAAGNELVLRDRPQYCHDTPSSAACIDLWKLVEQVYDSKTCEAIRGDGRSIYVSLCYREQKLEPHRVPDSGPCADECSNYQTYARLRDAVSLKISLDPPHEDLRCGPCCEPYPEECVLLARIDHAFSDQRDPEIHNEVRRPLGPYQATTVTGINWQHGAAYERSSIEAHMHSKGNGLKIRFSRPVLTGTIKRGVIDVWKVDDWGKAWDTGNFESLPVQIEPLKDATATELTFYVDEDLGSDDRIYVLVRTDFILDECCRPVDGNHVGGLVPLIHGYPTPKVIKGDDIPEVGDACHKHCGHYGPWKTGNGQPGGSFESWFFTVR